MASTSMSLGKYWEKFLKDKVKSGQYGSASEVVREALRDLEARDKMRRNVKAFVDEGIQSGSAGPLDMKTLIIEARTENAQKPSNAA